MRAMQRITAASLVGTIIVCLLFVFITLLPVVASDGRLKVVASITPLADFVKQVGGDHVAVTLLLPPGASPHTYEPTAKIVREISQAKIFFKIGSGLEFWADRLIKSAAVSIDIVDSSAGIELMRYTSDNKHDGHQHSLTTDPHIWLDPVICIGIIGKIESALSKADPANASLYKQNASVYREKLRKLDREIAERTKLFRTREYVTFHPAWNYFSRRYGLKVAAVIEEGPGKDPSPRHIRKIIEELKKLNTRVVFAEPQFSPKIAETIAKEAGGQVLFLDPVGGQKDKETYIKMMRHNLSIMETALR